MSHQIETHGTRAAAVFARTDAWHKLGTTVAGRAFTAEESMRLGHLGGWDVRTVPLYAVELTDDGATTLDAPGVATIRTNPFTGAPEALGVVGHRYQPLQNEEHAQFLNTLADESGAVFDTAGSLRGGRQVFITMRLPESLLIAGHDQVDVNIAALNSHDGTGAFRLLVTPVRVVCANTQDAAPRRCPMLRYPPGWLLAMLRSVTPPTADRQPPSTSGTSPAAAPPTAAVEVPATDAARDDGSPPDAPVCAQLRVTVRCREAAGHPHGHVFVHASAAPDRKAG